MHVEDLILQQLGHDPAQVLADAYRRDGEEAVHAWVQPLLLELAEHVGAMRGEDPRGYHGEQAAVLLRALLAGTRPTSADLARRHDLTTDQALDRVDAEAYRDRRLTALPELPAELRKLEAA